jgi:secondary thiamine-phosphate synthase enzyme
VRVIRQHQISLAPMHRGFHLITRQIQEAVAEWPDRGLLHVFILHTSAALAINENADPSVRHDLSYALDRLAPEHDPGYTHTLEGPDDMPAHIKAALIGSSVSCPIAERRLLLGQWQGIYLCEFRERAPGRKLVLSVWS